MDKHKHKARTTRIHGLLTFRSCFGQIFYKMALLTPIFDPKWAQVGPKPSQMFRNMSPAVIKTVTSMKYHD